MPERTIPRRPNLTPAMRQAVARRHGVQPDLKYYPVACFYCGKAGTMQWWPPGSKYGPKTGIICTLEYDHFIPFSRGGEHHSTNLVLACQVCNLSKGNRTLWEWLGWLQTKSGRRTAAFGQHILARWQAIAEAC